MKDAIKKALILGLGLSAKTVNDIETEVRKLGKQYGWTLQEIKELIHELVDDGQAIKAKVTHRVANIKKGAKIDRKTKRKARKIIKTVRKTAAKRIRYARKVLKNRRL